MKKRTFALTLTTLALCVAFSACGGRPAEGASQSAPKSSVPASGSAAQAENKLRAGILAQNSMESSSRKQWVQANGSASVRAQIQYTPFSSLNAMLLELNAGRVDYLQLPKSVASYLAAADQTLLINSQGRAGQHYHMAARTEDAALCEELNGAIEALKADGTLDKLVADYITNAESTPAVNALAKHEGGETHKIAVTGDLPPLDYVAADGTPAGFNVALLNAIAEKTGCNFEIVQMDAEGRLSALESGKVDLVFWIGCWDNETFEPEADGVSLSNSYFEEKNCLVGRSAEILDKAGAIYQNDSGAAGESVQLDGACIKLIVAPMLGDQIRVVAALDDFTLLHHENRVGIADGGQPVRDDECRSPLHQAVKPVFDMPLRPRVHGAGRFVQNQDRRVGHRRSGDIQ